jgi:hypothetical protein
VGQKGRTLKCNLQKCHVKESAGLKWFRNGSCDGCEQRNKPIGSMERQYTSRLAELLKAF